MRCPYSKDTGILHRRSINTLCYVSRLHIGPAEAYELECPEAVCQETPMSTASRMIKVADHPSARM
jgi:hypothetical protein